MKKLLFLTLIILVTPLILSQDCNTICIESGYSSGMCTTTCEEINLGRADNCAVKGEAFLVIGTEAIDTFQDNEPFIGENDTDPNWRWIIKNIRTKSRTNILDSDDDANHVGPLIGIENDFIATDIDSVDIKAITTGESFCFPKDVICIKFNKLTVSNYGTFRIQKATVDLSSFNVSWNNKNALLVQSIDDGDGLELQTTGYDDPVSGTDGLTTDKIWIIHNSSASYAGVFYEDSSNVNRLAGYINMDNTGDDINIADINYQKTSGTKIQLDLRGNFGTADNLYFVLDILGTEGAASTDGSDDIRINLKHSANRDITGFGNNSGSAEASDLVWVSTNIGLKDEDHRSLYGIIIKDPDTNNAQDRVELEIPEDQVKAEIEIKRAKSPLTKTEIEDITILGEQIPSPILSSELKLKEDYNLILIGGPCINPPLESFKEFPKCKEWPLKEGEAMIKYAKNKNNIALLVAGTTAEDTKMAAEFLKEYKSYGSLEGRYIVIKKGQKPVVLDPSTPEVDFSDYPVPFIKEGKFQNMRLVVGDNSKAEDTIGAQDIASSLLSITRRSAQFSNVTQNINQSERLIKDIPLGNFLGDNTFFSKTLNKASIKTLVSDRVSLAGNDINYEEVVMLYNGGPKVTTSLDSSDDNYGSEVYVEATSGSLRYYYSFKNEIDITTTSADSPLTINLLDYKLSITDPETDTKFKSQSASEYYMKAGDTVIVDGKKLDLIDIDKEGRILVKVNNTEEIISPSRYEVLDGLKIKNVESFDIEGSNCCCTDLLSNLL